MCSLIKLSAAVFRADRLRKWELNKTWSLSINLEIIIEQYFHDYNFFRFPLPASGNPLVRWQCHGKLFSLSISYIVIENELKSMLHFIREYKFPCLVAFVTWAVLCFIGFFPFQIWNADLGCHCRRLLRTCPLPDFEESCCVFLLGNHEFLVTECWCSYLLAFIGFWTTCSIASSRVCL